MAEGGVDPMELPKEKTDPGEGGVDETGRFQPGAASTPYHNDEQHEMRTFPREHSGLPKESGQAETSFTENVDETTPLIPPSDRHEFFSAADQQKS